MRAAAEVAKGEAMEHQSGFEGFLFDMDGTLLHTLPDLVVVTNKALELEGFPPHVESEILRFVGNGVMSLVLQAVPAEATEEQAQRVFDHFTSLYSEYGLNLTKPYPKMLDVLSALRASGKKLGIVSNKFEQGVRDVERTYFPSLFDVSHGEAADIPRKPAPEGLLRSAQEMGLDPEKCVYFGDSGSDMQAAHNAGMYAVGVTWGYQPLEMLEQGKPDELIDKVEDILSFQ